MAATPQATLTDDDFLAMVDEDGASESATSDPAPETQAPAEADEAEAIEQESPAAGDDEGDETGTQAVVQAPPATAPVGQPFRFKASGQEHVLPGALETADGSVIIPKAALSDFRVHLASAHEARLNFKSLQRETARKAKLAAEERTDKDLEADAVLAYHAAFANMTADEKWEHIENFEREQPKLELAVATAKLERDKKAFAEQRNPTKLPEEQTEERSALLTSELRATYTRLMENPAIKALDPADVNKVFQKHAKRVERLVVKGEKEGEEIFDDAEVIDDINLLIAIQKRTAPVSTAKDKNAQRNADTNPIPPAVRTSVPVGDGKKKGKGDFGPTPAERQKYRNAFMRGDLDTD